MTWLKKHKEQIIWGVQAFIVLNSMALGFWWSYMFIWFKVGLPMAWWSFVIVMIFALLSMIGTLAWIKKENDNG